MGSKAKQVANAQRAMQESVVFGIKERSSRKERMKRGTSRNADGSIQVPDAESLGIQRGKNNKLSAKGIGCLFSGEPTIRPAAKFIPGNDARLTSLLVKVQKGEASIDDVRPEALVFLAEDSVAGFQIIDGLLVKTHKADSEDQD